MMKKIMLLFYCSITYATASFAQISPPGLGEVSFGNWYAIGLRQDLLSNLESMTYIGTGFKTDEGSSSLFAKPAIFVVNQEFYYALSKHWKASLAGSYRVQNEDAIEIADLQTKSFREHEFRLYGRISHTSAIGRFKWTQTFRQEVRRFMNTDWHTTSYPLALRSRLKTQLSTSLDKNKQHTLTAGTEILFATKKSNESQKWSSLAFNETRLTLFYTYRFIDQPIALSIGYMDNLIKEDNLGANHYLSLDMVIENPFELF